MKVFTIDKENNITAYGAREIDQSQVPEGALVFASEREWAKLAAGWPSARLVEVWNSIPGLAPVRKFTDRKTAVVRLWKAIQSLQPGPGPEPASGAAAPASDARARRPMPAVTSNTAERTKREQVIQLLRRSQGATLPEIMALTGWQAHSVRGFISGALLKKLGLPVESFRSGQGERTYRIAAPPAAAAEG